MTQSTEPLRSKGLRSGYNSRIALRQLGEGFGFCCCPN
jgi:hypothetical protein